MSGAPAEPRADLPALTGIRGLAAWFVVLYHVRGGMAHYLPHDIYRFLSKGYLAVDLFFMLSGFVLWLNYSDRIRREGLRAIPVYLCRRLARIWPLHLFILGLMISFATLVSIFGTLNPELYPWWELPLHVFLIHNWGATDSLTWNAPSWSISSEFGAYLLFPLIAIAVDWRRLRPAFALFILSALPLLLWTAMSAGGATNLGDDIPRLGLLRALSEFTMGTVVCGLWLRFRNERRAALSAAAGAGAATLLLCLVGMWPEPLAIPIFLAALLLAVAITADSPANPLAWRPIHYLGTISYSTYLAHFLLFILFKLIFVDDTGHLPPLLLGLFLLLTLLASAALYHGLERPAQRALNRVYDRVRSRPDALSAAE